MKKINKGQKQDKPLDPSQFARLLAIEEELKTPKPRKLSPAEQKEHLHDFAMQFDEYIQELFEDENGDHIDSEAADIAMNFFRWISHLADGEEFEWPSPEKPHQ